MRLFEVRRAHIEAFARDLEAHGRARAPIARRLGTITCFYRYAEQESLIEHSPAVHVRRPKMNCESDAIGLDRNELGAMLVAAGHAGARDHALISLLALNGRGSDRAPQPGSTNRSDHTRCATVSPPLRSMPESPYATSKKPHPTPTPEPRCATTEPALARPSRHLHRVDIHRRRRPLTSGPHITRAQNHLRTARIPSIVRRWWDSANGKLRSSEPPKAVATSGQSRGDWTPSTKTSGSGFLRPEKPSLRATVVSGC